MALTPLAPANVSKSNPMLRTMHWWRLSADWATDSRSSPRTWGRSPHPSREQHGATYEIHGNIDFMRCVQGCGPRRAVPDLPHVSASCSFHPDWSEPLRVHPMPRLADHRMCCGSMSATTRPTASTTPYARVQRADALVVVGTTGATTLPAKLLQIAQLRGIPVVDINPDDNPFARVAERSPGGWLRARDHGFRRPSQTRSYRSGAWPRKTPAYSTLASITPWTSTRRSPLKSPARDALHQSSHPGCIEYTEDAEAQHQRTRRGAIIGDVA